MPSPPKPLWILDYRIWCDKPSQAAYARVLSAFSAACEDHEVNHLETLLSGFQELVKKKREPTLLKLEKMLAIQCENHNLRSMPPFSEMHLEFVHLAMRALLEVCQDREAKRLVAQFQIPWARYCLLAPEGIIDLGHCTWQLYYWLSHVVCTMTPYTRIEALSRLEEVIQVLDKPRSIQRPDIEHALSLAAKHDTWMLRHARSVALMVDRWRGSILIERAKETARNLLAPSQSHSAIPVKAFGVNEQYAQPFLLNRLLKSSHETPGQLGPEVQMVIGFMGQTYSLGCADTPHNRHGVLRRYSTVRPLFLDFGFDLKYLDTFMHDLKHCQELKVMGCCVAQGLPPIEFPNSLKSLRVGAYYKVVQEKGWQIYCIAAVSETTSRLLMVDLTGASRLDITARQFGEMMLTEACIAWSPFTTVRAAARKIVQRALQATPST